MEKAASGVTIQVAKMAVLGGLTGMPLGDLIYLSDTAGGYSATKGTFLQVVGRALSATDMLIHPARMMYEEMTQTAVTDTATITAAQLLTRVLDGTPTAAAAYTLPTAALLVAAMPNARVGSAFAFLVNNKSAGAFTITMAAGSGGTADGTLTVAQNAIRMFVVIVTNVTSASEAYFVYGIG